VELFRRVVADSGKFNGMKVGGVLISSYFDAEDDFMAKCCYDPKDPPAIDTWRSMQAERIEEEECVDELNVMRELSDELRNTKTNLLSWLRLFRQIVVDSGDFNEREVDGVLISSYFDTEDDFMAEYCYVPEDPPSITWRPMQAERKGEVRRGGGGDVGRGRGRRVLRIEEDDL